MKIDIVMPWVDGSDQKWQAEKNKYSSMSGSHDGVNRYRDWDLLRFWFRGVEKYMPWVNKIHFVTWGHIPSWLNKDNPKLNIVNHRDYIPDKYLPVFSSHPIELNMHRIEGLAEHFIYFNDDTYAVDYLEPESFFKLGLPADTVKEVPLRFYPGGIDHIIGNDMITINKNFDKAAVIKKQRKNWFSIKNIKPTIKNLYMRPVKGFSAFDNPHLPVPFLKETLEEIWENESELMEKTCSHKFRSDEDVNSWLIRYWQFVTGKFIQSRELKGRFFSIGKDDSLIEDAIENKKYKIVCLSDDDAAVDFEEEKRFLRNLFEKTLPDKSSFEL